MSTNALPGAMLVFDASASMLLTNSFRCNSQSDPTATVDRHFSTASRDCESTYSGYVSKRVSSIAEIRAGSSSIVSMSAQLQSRWPPSISLAACLTYLNWRAGRSKRGARRSAAWWSWSTTAGVLAAAHDHCCHSHHWSRCPP